MDVLTKHARLTKVAMVGFALSFLVLYLAFANGVTTAVVAPGTFDQDINVQQNAGGIIVTWVTDAAEDGEVIFSLGADASLGTTATDDRGAFGGRLNQKTHKVTVAAAGGSTINYNIVSGGVADPSGPYAVTIPSTSLPNPPDLLSGTVAYPNSAPGLECVVSFRVRNLNPLGPGTEHTSLWTTNLTNGGTYALDITNIRGHTGNSFFNNSKEAAFNYTRSSANSVIDFVTHCDEGSTASVTKTMFDTDTGTGFDFGTVTVLSDPKVTVADVTVDENIGNATVTLTIDQVNASAETVVDVAVAAGTATGGGTDYSAPAVTVTIPADSAIGSITIPINDDLLDEDNETFTVTISDGGGMNGAGIGGQNTATVTITDDDAAPNISITSATSVAEGAQASLTVALDAVSGLDVTFNHSTADGTASAGGDNDYTQAANVAGTITAGNTTALITVDTGDDGTYEADETFDVSLGNITNATVAVAGDDESVVTIGNDDEPGTTADTGATDEDTAFSSGASVLDNDDQVGGALIANRVSEPDNGGIATISPNGEYDFDPGNSFQNLGAGESSSTTFTYEAVFSGTLGDITSPPTNVVITISGLNDQPVAQAQSYVYTPGAPLTVLTGNGLIEGATDVDTNDILTIGNFTQPVEQGTTNVAGSVTGVDTTTGVFSYDPDGFEGIAEFTYDVQDDSGAVNDTSDTVTVLLIGLPTFSIADVFIPEDASEKTVTITLNPVADVNLTVNIASAQGTAEEGTDYTAVSQTLTFLSGSSSQSIPLAFATGDGDELDETFTLTLTNNLPADESNISNTAGTATVTIQDADPAPTLTFAATTASTPEGDATDTTDVNFTVVKTGLTELDIDFNVTTAGPDAEEGVDFDGSAVINALAGLTILASESSVTVSVTVNGDDLFEDDETFTVVLSNPTTASGDSVAITNDTATVTIENDDAPVGQPDTYNTDEADDVAPVAFVVAGPGVLGNDDAPIGNLTARITLTPANGALVVNAANSDGGFEYTPHDDFFGQDDFKYKPVWMAGSSRELVGAEVTVTINVADVEDDPLAVADVYPVVPGQLLSVSEPGVLTNDIDPDLNATFTAELVGNVPAGEGTLTFNADGSFDYDPGLFVGTAVFTYQLRDNTGRVSNIVEVNLTQGPTWKLSVDTNSVDEAAGAKVVATVTLVNADDLLPSQVTLRTSDGSAAGGSDFPIKIIPVTLGPVTGDTDQAFNIVIFNDVVREGVETFTVEIVDAVLNVSGIANSVISNADSTEDVDIDDQDDIPVASVVGVTLSEGSDPPQAVVSIVLTGQTLLVASVDWETGTTAGEAIDNAATPTGRVSDFVGDSNTETFTPDLNLSAPPLTQVVQISIGILDDIVDEHSETFDIVLTGTNGEATIPFGSSSYATVTIIDDDGSPSLKVTNKVVNEADGTISVDVELTGANTEGVSVDVSTGPGTATGDVDYTATVDTLDWGPDESGIRSLSVDIIDDNEEEDVESATILIHGATVETDSGEAAPTPNTPATIEDGSGLLTIYDNEPVVRVIGISSLGELLPGDWFFVAASDGDENAGEGGNVTMTLLNVNNAAMEQLNLGNDGLSFLAMAHDFDRIRSKITDAVYLGQVPEGQLEGISTVTATVGGQSPQATVNLLDARTNRNFFLNPGLNFTGVGLVPDADNDEFTEVFGQGVRTAPGFHDRIMEVGNDRAATLADVIQTVFTYQGGLWKMYNTADPILGTAGGGSVTQITPFQGMIIKTRPTVADAAGGDVDVFESVNVRGLNYDVPVRMNVRGSFIDSTTNSPLNPPSKVLNIGFNLLAPHISADTAFDTVFQGSGGDFRAIFSSAVSHQRQATPIHAGGIDVDFSIGPVTESASSDSQFTPPGMLRPELAYWVRVSSGSPTLVAAGPE